MRSLFANFTVVMYTASIMLSSAAPVLAAAVGSNDGLSAAPAVKDLPLEPDTQFDATHWYDTWWNTSVKGLEHIPANFASDATGVYGALKSVFKDGVKVGNVLIIRGGPDAARIAADHFENMGVHYLDTIRMFPEHAQHAGQRLAQAGKDVANVASKDAKTTADVASEESQALVRDTKDAGGFMGDVAAWMGRSYSGAAQDMAGDLKGAVQQTGTDVSNAAAWTGHAETDAATDTATWMKGYAAADIKAVQNIVDWTRKQPAEGAKDTVDWTSATAQTTGRWTKETAQAVGQDLKDTTVSAGQDIAATDQKVVAADKDIANAVHSAVQSENAFFNNALKATSDATFGKLGSVIKDEAANTKKTATWLWKKGYDDGVKDGFDLAGDNYFAGDVEGLTVGTFYSMAAVAEGVSFVLVLEPLAFTGHAALGVTKTVGLAGAGVLGTTGVAAGGLATEMVTGVGGTALTMGMAALGGVTDGAQVLYEGGRLGLHGVIGGGLIAGSALMTGIATGGAAATGVVRTVGGTVVGGVSAMAVGSVGLPLGEAGLATAGAVRMAGVGIAGAAMTTGALALGGLKMTGDVAWGAVKMTGVTAAGAAGEIFIPAVDAGIATYRLGRIAGTAIVENAIITPAVATWDIMSALTMGGWDLTRDPILGTFHLVAGATGFSYRLVGLSGALAVTAVAGTLYAVAHAPLSLVYYGGMWAVAAGGKLLDGITAPFAFGRQNVWKNERKPQLEEILDAQDPTVKDQIGDDVTYIRVVFSGEERGKVNFFTTEKDGKEFKFSRQVGSNCLVTYTSKDTSLVLNSKTYDRQCLAGEASK